MPWWLFLEDFSLCCSQAANDGLRGLYMLCFEGPDQGKGFVILCNGDNPGVLFQCEVARYLLGEKGLLSFPSPQC